MAHGKPVEEALRALEEADAELRSLVALHQKLLADTRRLSKLATELSRAIEHAEAEPGNAKARRQLVERAASVSLMQLEIGQNVDAESREFTLVSNVMKTKHDTAKNSIGNIR